MKKEPSQPCPSALKSKSRRAMLSQSVLTTISPNISCEYTCNSNEDLLMKLHSRESNDDKHKGAKSTFGGSDVMGMLAMSIAY